MEIGDEILEVNGKSLDGATHTEVISHIHQVLYPAAELFCVVVVQFVNAPAILSLISAVHQVEDNLPPRQAQERQQIR